MVINFLQTNVIIKEKGYENYHQKENVLIFYQNLPTNSLRKCIQENLYANLPKTQHKFHFRQQLISLYELEFFDSQVLQDARVKVTESGYIPGQAFPTEQAQLEGYLFYYRPFCTIKMSCDIVFTKNMKAV